jgi:hypothetical protein
LLVRTRTQASLSYLADPLVNPASSSGPIGFAGAIGESRVNGSLFVNESSPTAVPPDYALWTHVVMTVLVKT